MLVSSSPYTIIFLGTLILQAPPTESGVIEPKPWIDIPDHWQHYLVCLLFHLTLPLLPIGIEYFTTDYLKTSTLTISAAMYAISIGASSKSILEFGGCIVGSIIFAVMFGINSATENFASVEKLALWNGTKSSALTFIVLIFALHAIARYNRHVLYRQPFWEFIKKEGA